MKAHQRCAAKDHETFLPYLLFLTTERKQSEFKIFVEKKKINKFDEMARLGQRKI